MKKKYVIEVTKPELEVLCNALSCAISDYSIIYNDPKLKMHEKLLSRLEEMKEAK